MTYRRWVERCQKARERQAERLKAKVEADARKREAQTLSDYLGTLGAE